MASKWFPIHVPINSTVVIIAAIIVGLLFLFTRSRNYSPINVKTGVDGKPGNPTGQQGIDYRILQQEPPPQAYPGANIITGPNSWV